LRTSLSRQLSLKWHFSPDQQLGSKRQLNRNRRFSPKRRFSTDRGLLGGILPDLAGDPDDPGRDERRHE